MPIWEYINTLFRYRAGQWRKEIVPCLRDNNIQVWCCWCFISVLQISNSPHPVYYYIFLLSLSISFSGFESRYENLWQGFLRKWALFLKDARMHSGVYNIHIFILGSKTRHSWAGWLVCFIILQHSGDAVYSKIKLCT